MFRHAALCAALVAPLSALAADATPATSNEDLRAIREQIRQIKESYEQRIAQLEQRLQQAAASQPGSAPTSSAGAFNPAVSLILSGAYGNLQRDPAIAPTGFAMSPNNSGHTRGFSLKESELGISASIDPQFSGMATVALAPGGGASVENAFVQTTALGGGFKLKFGRFFSGLGYLNEQHAHAWDFVDQPLVYRTLWDNQLGEDGVQLKWLAPTDTFIELGAELGRGRGFPGSDRQKNGLGAGTLFAHVGNDIGVSHSWRAGLSLHQTRRENAVSSNVPDRNGNLVSDSFTGDSKTAGLDFVWKYAPNGNSTVTNLKLQGEYFRRRENGLLTYDTALGGANITDSYANTQSGWYLQSVYQFVPRWRAGLRYDGLDSGTANVGALNAANVVSDYRYTPWRGTLMLDYSPSEFSRLRVQFAHDQSRQHLPDNQLFVQYVMSMGAHGAHQF